MLLLLLFFQITEPIAGEFFNRNEVFNTKEWISSLVTPFASKTIDSQRIEIRMNRANSFFICWCYDWYHLFQKIFFRAMNNESSSYLLVYCCRHFFSSFRIVRGTTGLKRITFNEALTKIKDYLSILLFIKSPNQNLCRNNENLLAKDKRIYFDLVLQIGEQKKRERWQKGFHFFEWIIMKFECISCEKHAFRLSNWPIQFNAVCVGLALLKFAIMKTNGMPFVSIIRRYFDFFSQTKQMPSKTW